MANDKGTKKLHPENPLHENLHLAARGGHPIDLPPQMDLLRNHLLYGLQFAREQGVKPDKWGPETLGHNNQIAAEIASEIGRALLAVCADRTQPIDLVAALEAFWRYGRNPPDVQPSEEAEALCAYAGKRFHEHPETIRIPPELDSMAEKAITDGAPQGRLTLDELRAVANAIGSTVTLERLKQICRQVGIPVEPGRRGRKSEPVETASAEELRATHLAIRRKLSG